MTRISSRPPVTARPPSSRPPALSAATKKQLKASFEKLSKGGKLEFSRAPAEGDFLRVSLKAGKGPDQYSYTALIPRGGKGTDPNKAGGFLIERSGGFAGLRETAGPFTFDGKKLAKPGPFFERFLEGQQRPGDGMVTTLRYPSDNESVEPKPTKPGGGMQTMRYPSDNESAEPRPGGTVQTLRFPSDNEDPGVR